ncbi:MAG: host attachment protein [Alphaproteobacteria bacterium]
MKNLHLAKQSKIEDISPPATDGKHWIIVADEKTAHIYKRTPKGVERIPEENACCSKAFPEEGAGHDSVFLPRLARWLDSAEREGAFERLVIIAPPAIMQELRTHLGDNVDTRLCKAKACDVEKIAEDEIEDHLTEVVWL